MEIRLATAADAEGILDCLRIAFEPYRQRYTPAGFEDTILTPRSLANRFQTMTLFVAVTDHRIIGTIAAAVHGTEGHLRGMAVLPQWQGSDVARSLIDAAETELIARGCALVTLDTTEPLKRAARFYEKCGYRSTGRTADFFGMRLFEFAKRLGC